ncbi:hypothetical protein [Clostridium estertheticum]|uniref:hypothetical protein n=1 Tax=Clostridium estertheticum TaxID=238834 RepID=UPI001CF3023B|nr:hypothetical protein [Clostridium estertheticum]MCB2356400.1 hypothetical protein [Clostridium estertheticum]WAG39654.1 hypothetical protein LL065_15340 [Clostridium estertheticum]
MLYKLRYLIIAIVFLILTKLIVPISQFMNWNIAKENQDLVVIIFGSLAIIFSLVAAVFGIKKITVNDQNTGNIAGIGLMGLYFTNILKKDLKN